MEIVKKIKKDDSFGECLNAKEHEFERVILFGKYTQYKECIHCSMVILDNDNVEKAQIC